MRDDDSDMTPARGKLPACPGHSGDADGFQKLKDAPVSRTERTYLQCYQFLPGRVFCQKVEDEE